MSVNRRYFDLFLKFMLTRGKVQQNECHTAADALLHPQLSNSDFRALTFATLTIFLPVALFPIVRRSPAPHCETGAEFFK